ncbi:MAG: tRNA-dihydrouridine synthase [Phycisphaerae bacterium]
MVAPYLAKRLEEVGVAMITIHGRTTEMRFAGQARLDGIAQVVAAVKTIPVIGNGDIHSPQDAKRMINATGCTGVMIGRAALSCPWIFRDTAAYLAGEPAPPPLTIAQKCQLMRDHFYNLCRFRDDRVAVMSFRKRVSWYAKTMSPCRILRDQIRKIDSIQDFENTLEEFLAWRTDYDTRVRRGLIPALTDDVSDPAAPGGSPGLEQPVGTITA